LHEFSGLVTPVAGVSISSELKLDFVHYGFHGNGRCASCTRGSEKGLNCAPILFEHRSPVATCEKSVVRIARHSAPLVAMNRLTRILYKVELRTCLKSPEFLYGAWLLKVSIFLQYYWEQNLFEKYSFLEPV
jgi:hypothetical protein